MSGSDLMVDLGARSYPIHFRHDAADELTKRAAELARGSGALVVTDSTVGPLHAGPWAEALRATGARVELLEFPAGEAHKTLDTLRAIYDRALAAGVDRHTPVFAFGGGVVGDLGGFAAATLLRGLPYVQIPTTVLSQVDSSVGGKTGVNTATGKNLVGAFHQPRWVFADMARLRTLPRDEVRSGLAEAIKHGALADPGLLDAIAQDAHGLLNADADALLRTLPRAVLVKANVVAADELEQGHRAVLNLGHTLGHAIESAAGYGAIRHGEAVALGIRFAGALSRARGWLPAESAARLTGALDAVGLPADYAAWLRPKVLAKVARDKKVRGEYVGLVLLRDLGQPQIVRVEVAALVAEALAMCTGGDDARTR